MDRTITLKCFKESELETIVPSMKQHLHNDLHHVESVTRPSGKSVQQHLGVEYDLSCLDHTFVDHEGHF